MMPALWILLGIAILYIAVRVGLAWLFPDHHRRDRKWRAAQESFSIFDLFRWSARVLGPITGGLIWTRKCRLVRVRIAGCEVPANRCRRTGRALERLSGLRIIGECRVPQRYRHKNGRSQL